MAIIINDNTRQRIPFFSENQVLRAEDLNQLVRAVLGQLRQSRVFTIGLGIREGFAVSVTEDPLTIVVSNGYGVSSDGYGFELEDCEFTHFRKAGDRFKDFVPLAGNCTKYGALMDLVTEDGLELGGNLNVVELQQGWQGLADGVDQLMGAYCLLYLYREVSIAEPSCFNECESKGAEQAGNFHAILVPAGAYADIFTRREDTDNGVLVNLNDYAPMLPALGRQENLVKLCSIGSWEELYIGYRKACLQVIPALTEAYGAVEQALTPGLDGNPAETPIALKVKETVTNLLDKKYPEKTDGNCPDIQYLYAWLRELVLAFDACKAALNDKLLYLGGEQGGDSDLRCAFPGHLGLRGIVFDVEGNPQLRVRRQTAAEDPCRTAYLPAGASSERQQLLALATALFARLEALVNPNNLLLSTLGEKDLQDLRITPDARRFPFLDGRALPFYYRPQMMSPWRVSDQPNARAYRYVEHDEKHPLLFADTGWDFYRIEGHLGRPFIEREVILEEDVVVRDEALLARPRKQKVVEKTIVDRLEAMRDCFNLAFDVVAVSIDEADPQEPAPEIMGTDWENWYKNVRFDLLLWLGSMSQSDNFEKIKERIDVVLDFLKAIEHLSDVNDWKEFPFDNCLPLPETLNSATLERFVAEYAGFMVALKEVPGRLGEDSPWQFDPHMAECIREAAIAQRLFQERVWRKTFFAGFAQEHPGLVHEGGVPKGGTFVMVTKGGFDRKELIDILVKNGIKEERLREATNDDLRAYARELGLNLSFFGQQRVVADFCLPDRCCGSGPVHLHHTPPAPVPDPTLEVVSDICYFEEKFPDGIPLLARVTPEGGNLQFAKADGTPLNETFTLTEEETNISLTSITSADFVAGVLTLTATYEAGGKTVTTSVLIRQQAQILDPGIQLDEDLFMPDGRVRYRLFIGIDPADAPLSFTVDGQAVTYDETENLLLVRRELVEGSLPLLIVAGEAPCSDQRELDLPSLPDDDVILLSTTAILNNRRESRQELLNSLVDETPALAAHPAFRRAFLYVSDAGPGADPKKALQPALNALVKLVEGTPEHAVFARKTGEILATGFLDKLALCGDAEQLTATRKKLLQSTVTTLGKLDVNANTVFSDWGVSDLYGGPDKDRLTEIGKILRE